MQVYELIKDGVKCGEAIEFSDGFVSVRYEDVGFQFQTFTAAERVFPETTWRNIWSTDPPTLFSTMHVSPEMVENIKVHLDEMGKNADWKPFVILYEAPGTCGHGVGEGEFCGLCAEQEDSESE